MTTIVYLTASQWGMRWARPPASEKLPDAECYVHHTGGGQLSPDAATAFRALNDYAISSKGYSALDYDVLVHYDPARDLLTIGEGRGKWMSAATLDRNEQGEAVCLVGNFESRQPHPAEIEGVALGIVYGIRNGWLSPLTSIAGHRDNPAHPGATACPGRHLHAQLPVIRARVAELLNPPVYQPEDWTMTPTTGTLFDSRDWGPSPVTVGRPLPVSIDGHTQALLRIEAINAEGGGYLSLDGGKNAVVNYDGTRTVETDLAFVGLPATLTVHGGACHIKVSMQGVG